MDLHQTIAEMVKKTVSETVGTGSPQTPELVRIADIVAECGVDRSVIDSLVQDSPANGFPAIRLGPKTILIDRRRFHAWLAAGGLAEARTK